MPGGRPFSPSSCRGTTRCHRPSKPIQNAASPLNLPGPAFHEARARCNLTQPACVRQVLHEHSEHHARPALRSHRRDHHRPPRKAPGVRGVREDRRAVGPLADVPAVRHDPVLRRLTQPARQQARPGERPSRDRVRGARRALAILLSGRRVRRVLIMAVVLGIHHVTAIASDPQRNLDFYVGLLGLRLVKRTVNFDDPETYHLYYGDEVGTPGSIMTFFPWPGARPGRHGTGQVAVTAFAVLPRSLGFWVERLVRHGIRYEGPTHHVISFKDHDGLMLEIVGHPGAEARPAWGAAPGIPREHAIHGFYGVTIWADKGDATERVLVDTLGFRPVHEDGSTRRFAVADGETPRAAIFMHRTEAERVDEHSFRGVPLVRPDGHAIKAVDRVLTRNAGGRSPGGPRLGAGVADDLEHQPIVVLERDHVVGRPLVPDAVTHQPLDPESERVWQHGARRDGDLSSPVTPGSGAGPGEEGHDAPRSAHLIAVVEMVCLRIVEIYGALDESEAEQPDVEVEVALRVARDRGDVVDAEDAGHDQYSANASSG